MAAQAEAGLLMPILVRNTLVFPVIFNMAVETHAESSIPMPAPSKGVTFG